MKTINLTRGYVAIVDDADFDKLSQHKWHAHGSRSGTVYAVRCVKDPSLGFRPGTKKTYRSRSVLMHRELCSVSDGLVVDHINGNGCDNRRENLRCVTQQENLLAFRKPKPHTSKHRGVFFRHLRNKWCAQVADKFIGHFSTEDEAAHAREVYMASR